MTKEPKKSTCATDASGNKMPGSERQSIDDLMELRDAIEDHPEGLILGQVIVEMIDLLADSGTTFKDVRDVKTADGYASFLLTDHEHPDSRIALTEVRRRKPTLFRGGSSRRARDTWQTR